MGKDISLLEVGTGLAFISPIDELAVWIISGGSSSPTIPIQAGVSALVGTVVVAHGLRLWR